MAGRFHFSRASLNLADDDELLGMMKRAGLRRVFIGIETPVEESLKEAQKGQNTRRDMLAAVHKIQGYGMEVMAGFIVGFDTDPADIVQRQIDFIRASAIPRPWSACSQPCPPRSSGGALQREGRLLAQSSGNNTDGSLNFVPRMAAAEVVAGYKHILQTIYKPAEFYQRASESLDRVKQENPEPQGNNLLLNLLSLGQMVFTLGVRDRERGHFWRFLGRTLVRQPKRVLDAIVLAALGYHFRRITEDLLPMVHELTGTQTADVERADRAA